MDTNEHGYRPTNRNLPTEYTEKKAENDQGPHAKAAEDAKLGRGFLVGAIQTTPRMARISANGREKSGCLDIRVPSCPSVVHPYFPVCRGALRDLGVRQFGSSKNSRPPNHCTVKPRIDTHEHEYSPLRAPPSSSEGSVSSVANAGLLLLPSLCSSVPSVTFPIPCFPCLPWVKIRTPCYPGRSGSIRVHPWLINVFPHRRSPRPRLFPPSRVG